MKASALLIFVLTGALSAQVMPTASIFPEIPDEKVLAVFDDGAKFTMQQFRALYTIMPPQAQQAAMNNRREWLQQYALMRKLAAMAEREKIDQQSPTKEALEYQRMAMLSQIQLNVAMNTRSVEGTDIVKTYETQKDNYRQVKLKVIYIAFIPDATLKAGGPQGLTEAEAHAKASKLVKEIRGGADFVKLVKTYSDDRDSKEKDGDFATMRPTDNIPEAIRSAIFALKQGEISDPVRQPNGFYIFKADEVTHQPLSEVRDEIYNQIKMKAHEKWMNETVAGTKVDLVDKDFFKASAPTPAPAPPGKK